jgi:hypothetical protein
MKKTKKHKNDLKAAIHEIASGLHNAGMIDKHRYLATKPCGLPLKGDLLHREAPLLFDCIWDTAAPMPCDKLTAMSEIIRRKKAVPVEARRVEPAVDVINIPGAGQIPLPPVIPGVTQNIIVVNVPQAAAAPVAPVQAAPVQTREIHHHTTHIYQAPRRPRMTRGTSFLGTLGFVLGGVAVGTTYVPQILWLAKPVAVAAFGCAGFGFIGALLFNRVGKFMPMLGMLVSATGYYLWLKNTGQPIQLPKLDLSMPPTATTPATNAPATPAPNPPSPPVKKTRPIDHSIFGDGGGAWVKPDEVPPATPR